MFLAFYNRPDTFTLGICNGCQLFGLLGWVPRLGLEDARQPRFVHNLSGRFESRWSTVRVQKSPAMMFKGMEDLVFGIHVDHGEGRLFFPDEAVEGRFSRVDWRRWSLSTTMAGRPRPIPSTRMGRRPAWRRCAPPMAGTWRRPRLSLYLLGPTRVEQDGRPLEVDTRKAIALLAYLATTGKGQPRAALISLLWPESDPYHASAGLRRTLSVLRSALAGDWLRTDRSTIALPPNPAIWSDVAEFRTLLEARRSHDHPLSAVCPRLSTALGPGGRSPSRRLHEQLQPAR